MIEVITIRTGRQGFVHRWELEDGTRRQRRAKSKKAREREEERKRIEAELNRAAQVVFRWSDFTEMVENVYLPELSRSSRPSVRTAVSKLESVLLDIYGDQDWPLGLITLQVMDKFQQKNKRDGLAESSIRSTNKTIWAALRLGMRRGLVPKLEKQRELSTKKRKFKATAKGRPLKPGEVKTLRDALPSHIRPIHQHQTDRYLRSFDAAHLIGMRLTETQHLAWERRSESHYIKGLDSDSPRIVFTEIQKNGRHQEAPLTREAIKWLRSLDQDGPWVCRLDATHKIEWNAEKLSRATADAGRACGIVSKVDEDGLPLNHATFHDLRRTFAAGLMQWLPINEVIALTRHSDPKVLLDFYVAADVDELSQKLLNPRHQNTLDPNPQNTLGGI